MKSIQWDSNGRTYRGWAEKRNGFLWVHFQGRTFWLEDVADKILEGSGETVDDPSRILSPMPGKITQLPVSLGQEVKANDVVVRLEAMKMEYSLKALAAGKVSALQCKVGDQVEMGQELISLEVQDV